MQKSDEIECQNGGSFDGSKCICEEAFGIFCEHKPSDFELIPEKLKIVSLDALKLSTKYLEFADDWDLFSLIEQAAKLSTFNTTSSTDKYNLLNAE